MDQSHKKADSADREPAIVNTEIKAIPTKSEQEFLTAERLNTYEKASEPKSQRADSTADEKVGHSK